MNVNIGLPTELKNYTLARFLKQDKATINSYMQVMILLKPLPNFHKSCWFSRKHHGVNASITELTFGQVNTVRRLVGKACIPSLVKAVSIVYNLTEKQVYNMKIIRFYAIVNFLHKEVKNLYEAEVQHYKTEATSHDTLLKNCGIENLNRFGSFLIIDALAHEQPWRYKEIENLPYMVVHYKLWLNAARQNIRCRAVQMAKQ